ncbi:PrsW family intramembrane metalloprotease [Actinomycetota bacterium]
MTVQQPETGEAAPLVGDGYAAAPAPYAGGFVPETTKRNPTARPFLRNWLLTGVITAGFLVLALVVALYYGSTLGVSTTLLALLVAILPLGIVVPTFLWLDRFEAEPTRHLIFAFLWGALAAAVLAAFLNTTAMAVFQGATSPEEAMATTAVFVAPPVEEAAKALAILLIVWFRRREFDGVIDGMVYAGMAASGFAFTENIQYLGRAYEMGGGEMLAGTFIGRCLMTPFAHPMFTILTGIGIGIAASTRSGALKVLAPLAGYLLAVLAHGLWNLAAVTGGEGMLLIYLGIEMPIFLAFLALIAWARRREGRLIGRYLTPYAAVGWFTPAEVSMLSSMPRRREARIWAKANGGGRALSSMRAFQDAASELALLRQRMHHSAADDHAIATERVLLDTLVARRAEFLGRPMV